MTLRVVFMGSPEFGVPTLRALNDAFDVVGVVTQPDKPKGRGRKTEPTAVKTVAEELGLEVISPLRLAEPEAVAALKTWTPDVIVVAAYGKLLPLEILDMPRLGCVDLHPSLLPRHRGASPIPGAILAGDELTGNCTMLMDRGMDTGPVLLCSEIPVEPGETAASLHDRMAEPGARLVVKTLQGLERKEIEPTPQNESLATYTQPLTKEDGRIDWNNGAEYLDRLVRAMNPWPTAFTTFNNDPIKVWKASLENGTGRPSAIVDVSSKGITVGTGNGLLVLQEIQPPGKKRMSAADFALGRSIRTGDTFGGQTPTDL